MWLNGKPVLQASLLDRQAVSFFGLGDLQLSIAWSLHCQAPTVGSLGLDLKFDTHAHTRTHTHTQGFKLQNIEGTRLEVFQESRLGQGALYQLVAYCQLG